MSEQHEPNQLRRSTKAKKERILNIDRMNREDNNSKCSAEDDDEIEFGSEFEIID